MSYLERPVIDSVNFLPRPLRDVGHAIFPSTYRPPRYITDTVARDPSVAFLGSVLAFGSDRVSKGWMAAIRMAGLAIAFFAAKALEVTLAWNMPTLLVGSLISLPCVVIGAGTGLLYTGSIALISSLATGSIESFGIGLALGFVGWQVLEYHDIIPLGILERAAATFTAMQGAIAAQELIRKACEAIAGRPPQPLP